MRRPAARLAGTLLSLRNGGRQLERVQQAAEPRECDGASSTTTWSYL